jgi:hypothetical protein
MLRYPVRFSLKRNIRASTEYKPLIPRESEKSSRIILNQAPPRSWPANVAGAGALFRLGRDALKWKGKHIKRGLVMSNEMSGRNPSFSDARQLEEIRFGQWISEASVQMRDDICASERGFARRGYSSSGARFKAEIDIMLASAENVIGKAIAFREELGAKVPALLTTENHHEFGSRLNQHVDALIKGIQTRAKLRPRDTAGGAVISEVERRAWAVKARAKNKLAALPLEARLGMHQPEEPRVTTFNISHSTIANLNLGSVMGDLNSSIQHLNTEGRNELAEEFRKMAEAIGSSQDLNDDARKEMLENLSVVSEESAKPPEQRKMGPLKSSLVAIKSSIGIAAQLLAVYQGLEHALKAAGVIH